MKMSSAHDVVPFEGRFPSWEAFDVARKAHCEKTHTMYVCRNTVKVAVANKRRRLQVPDHWVYDRKVYVCTHGYKRVSRSAGSRPRQRVRFTNCKAKFTACVMSELSADGGETLFIAITGQHVVHSDHPVSLEQWRMYSQNRAAVIEHPLLSHEVELMRRTGSNKRATRAHIETLSGKVCTMKDMHNLYARLKKRGGSTGQAAPVAPAQPQRSNSSANVLAEPHRTLDSDNPVRVEAVLQRFVDADVENHVSILSGDDGSNDAICLATRAMKEHFQVFPELLVLDVELSSPSTAKPCQQLHGFLSLDTLGNAKPIFLGLSSSVSPPLLQRMCQDLKRTHPKWMRVKVMVLDKLLPDVVQVLTREFPQVKILLCQLQVLKLFNELVADTQQRATGRLQPQSQLDGDVLNEEEAPQLLQQLVFARSESRYSRTKALLAHRLTLDDNVKLLAELERVWDRYRSLWVSYARGDDFDLSPLQSKGSECYWNPLKSVFRRTSSSTEPIATAPTASQSITQPGVGHLPTVVLPHGQPGGATTVGQLRSVTPDEHIPVSAALEDGHPTRGKDCDSQTKGVAELLSKVKAAEEDWTSKMLVLELTRPVGNYDPLLHLMVNCLGSFAVDLITAQLTAQSAFTNGSVSITKTRASKAQRSLSTAGLVELPATEPAMMRWQHKSTREKRVLQRDGSGCDCEFFALYQLPCRHLIWYEITVLQHQRLSTAAVGLRWFLRTFRTPTLTSQRESNEVEYHLL